MLRLNDDCLCLIFNHLELRDEITLTAVCERFRNIIVSVQWRSISRRFPLSKWWEEHEITPEEHQSLLELLELIADRIEHLDISKDSNIYLHFEFPILRVLEIHDHAYDFTMQWMVAHCPLMEELYLHEYIVGDPWPHIVRMRRLRVLHVPHISLDVRELKKILTLPLTELSIHKFCCSDDDRLVAEALIGASKLRILRMHYHESTPGLMKSIVELASTTELRNPLTVYINYGRDVYNTAYYSKCYKDDQNIPIQDERNPGFLSYIAGSFMKYHRSLQALIDNQVFTSTYTILLSEWKIEFRFFCQSNEK